MAVRLTPRQKDVVEFLNDNDGEANEFELATYLGIATHHVRGMLARLEQKGVLTADESFSRMPCSGGEKITTAWLHDEWRVEDDDEE